MPAVVRLARTRDVPLLKRLHLDTLPSDEFPNFAAGWWWVATTSDDAVAFCGLTPSARWADTGYLVRAGVMPIARGHGLQRRMIQARSNHARRLGMRWLITDTFNNPASANSLIACGFRLFEPRKPWGLDGALYWRKPLTK